MKILLFLCLATLFFTGISSEIAADNTTVSEQTSDVPTTASTEAPTSSTEVPTSASTDPHVTTTTEIPTTLPPATNTTTDPTTTSTIEPSPSTTTQAPGPAECEWNVTQKGVTCIRADFKMSFVVSLQGKNYPINLGCHAKSELSDCSSNETQKLVLYESNYNLTMVFEKEDAKFYVKEIEFGYNLPEGEGLEYSNSTKIFTVKAGTSYLCKSKSKISLGNVTIEISEIHVQAFLEKDDKNFGTADECAADDKVSDVVPIAVGVALAALIIIVLIAYLVGRRRSRQMGYQSV